jgi:hypothetical protein
MNQELIDMARQVGFARYMTDSEINWKMFETFADLVAAAEREACAKLADEWAVGWPHPAKTIALDIRARGETK